MTKIKTTVWMAGLLAAALGASVPARAAEEQDSPPRQSWSFSGAFGHYDRAQLQRGFKVYREVCSNCHALSRVNFRNLAEEGGPQFSEGQIKALSAEYKVQDGPNDAGDMFERPGRPSDAFPKPFPNENAARAANGGAYPPDFSLLAKARDVEDGFPWFIVNVLPFFSYQEGGPDYIHGILTGYEEAPKGETLTATQHWNKYMPGHKIAMPKPISDNQVDYPKGPNGQPQVPQTVDQYAKDVAAFMMWAAEPKLEQRKETGFKVMVFLVVFAGLMYFTKKKIWSRVGGDPVSAV